MLLEGRNHSVLVSPKGGSALRWQWREHDIFWPMGMAQVGNTLKERGGAFWCFPNFGPVAPDSKWPQPQHGFLRREVLGVISCSDESARFTSPLRLQSERDTGGLRVREVGVVVDPEGFRASLCMKNVGPERIPILPAIHPYFKVPPDGFSLKINQWCMGWSPNQPTEEKNMPSPTLSKERLKNRMAEGVVIPLSFRLPIEVHLHGIGCVELWPSRFCSHVVVWSDNLPKYICVEPVFGEPGTYGDSDRGKWLEPGAEETCEVNFRFRPERTGATQSTDQ